MKIKRNEANSFFQQTELNN